VTPDVLGLVLASALIHAVWSFSIKGSRDPLSFNVVQTIPLTLAFLATLFFVDLTALSGRFYWLLLGTGVAHGAYLYGLSLALSGGDLSLVYPIARSTPAFLPLFAIPLTGERLTGAGMIGIATVVAGMWTVQFGGTAGRDEADAGSLFGRLTAPHFRFAYLALAATVAYGLLDKALMLELSDSALPGPIPPPVFGFFALWLTCSLFFVPAALIRMERGSLGRALRSEWKRASVAATISVVGYSLILKAFETAPASYVVAVRQVSVLFVLALSIAFLGERPGRLRILGAIATVAGVALVAVAG
jgi:drug/metabolite transporter (DMT)-like permease